MTEIVAIENGWRGLTRRLAMGNRNNPRCDTSHLDDPAFWRRISGDPPTLESSSDDSEPVARRKRKPAAFRQSDLARAVGGAMKAGLSVKCVEIDKAGRIVTGQPEATDLVPKQETSEDLRKLV